MNLLDLFVKVGVDDQASGAIAGISEGAIARASAMGQAMYDGVKFGIGKMADGVKAIVGGALEGYASYEQLVGGVDKLYQGASDKLQKYAQNAYKTSGMSANDYMEQATSFSAALINSLGGDVDKAAEQTDKAMRLMSDNVNTFGTDSEAVQNAIQGLSRENYTMLDNLKLGYAGTKEGMQQLIDDANAYAKEQGINADLTMGNFSDMIDAIDLIQQKQNIWGTTSREAMTTIEGSISMTKAAWDNLLTAIGSGDPELIENATTGIVDGIFGTFDIETGKREGGIINNVLPVVQHVGEAIVGQIPTLAEDIAWNLIDAFNDTFGTDFDAEGIMSSLEQGFQTASDRIGQVLDGLSAAWDSFSSTVDTGYLSVMLGNLQSIAENLWGFIEENVLPHMPEIGEAIGNIANFLMSVASTALTVINNLSPFLPMILGAIAAVSGLQAVIGIIGAISGAVTFLTTVLIPAISMIGSLPGLIAVITTVLGGPITIIAAIVGAIVAFLATNEEARAKILEIWEAVKAKFFEVKDAIGQKLTEIGEFFGSLKEAAEQKLGEVVDFFASLPDKITSALGDLGSLLVGAGESIISGLWDGLTSKFAEVQDWVSGVGSWIAEHKGPKQYDLGLLVDNGKWIMQSLQTGLEKGLPGVRDTLSGISDQIQSDVNASADVNVAQGGNADVVAVLTSILNAIPSGVYLDGRTLVGSLAPDMNAAMGVL